PEPLVYALPAAATLRSKPRVALSPCGPPHSGQTQARAVSGDNTLVWPLPVALHALVIAVRGVDRSSGSSESRSLGVCEVTARLVSAGEIVELLRMPKSRVLESARSGGIPHVGCSDGMCARTRTTSTSGSRTAREADARWLSAQTTEENVMSNWD